MWDRRELKARGRFAFRANYWPSVVAGLVFALVTFGGAVNGANSGRDAGQDMSDLLYYGAPGEYVLPTLLGGIVAGSMAFTLLDFLLLNPLEVGCKRFFLVNSGEPARLGELAYGFTNGYVRFVYTLFLRDVFIFAWSLLFFIPGIVKTYSYQMVPYILADDPTISGTEAIALSREMMNGHKWRAFVLDVSFFGWMVLTAMTGGILGVFYVNPYMAATYAELYLTLREEQSAPTVHWEPVV